MQEKFYEECAKVHNEKSAKRRYVILNIFSIFSYVLAGFWIVIDFGYLIFISTDLFFKIVYMIFPLAFFITWGIVLGKLKDKMYVDYDYTFVTGSIRFSKVINNFKRKHIITFDFSMIEKIGKYGSKTYERYELMPDKKIKVLTSNSVAEDGKSFYYIVCNVSGIKYVFVLECTEVFIGNVINCSSRTVIEEDFYR